MRLTVLMLEADLKELTALVEKFEAKTGQCFDLQ